MFTRVGICEQNITETNFTVTYDTVPSYPNATATLSCIDGRSLIETGYAKCGDDGEWTIVKSPRCEGIDYI